MYTADRLHPLSYVDTTVAAGAHFTTQVQRKGQIGGARSRLGFQPHPIASEDLFTAGQQPSSRDD
jgi:hypothetical protein